MYLCIGIELYKQIKHQNLIELIKIIKNNSIDQIIQMYHDSNITDTFALKDDIKDILLMLYAMRCVYEANNIEYQKYMDVYN